MAIDLGGANVAREVTEMDVGIANVTRQCTEGHVAVANVARRFLGKGYYITPTVDSGIESAGTYSIETTGGKLRMDVSSNGTVGGNDWGGVGYYVNGLTAGDVVEVEFEFYCSTSWYASANNYFNWGTGNEEFLNTSQTAGVSKTYTFSFTIHHGYTYFKHGLKVSFWDIVTAYVDVLSIKINGEYFFKA